MPNHKKTFDKIMRGKGNNIKFNEFVSCLESIGFDVREGKGDHKVVFLKDSPDSYAIQPDKGGNAVAYQVRKIRKMITQYKVGGDEHEV